MTVFEFSHNEYYNNVCLFVQVTAMLLTSYERALQVRTLSSTYPCTSNDHVPYLSFNPLPFFLSLSCLPFPLHLPSFSSLSSTPAAFFPLYSPLHTFYITSSLCHTLITSHHPLSSLFPSIPPFPLLSNVFITNYLFIYYIQNNVFCNDNSGSTTSTTSKRSEKLEMLTDPSRITVDDSTYKGPHVSLPLTLLTVRNIIELYKSHKVCTKTD